MVKKTIGMTGFILVLLWMMPGQTPAGQTLSIAHPEFYPFFERSDNGATTGFFYDIIVEAIDHRMNLKTRWGQMPWKRCQQQVRSGNYDAMITVPTDERASYSKTHTDPFYLKQLKVFTYRGHDRSNEILRIRSISDIKQGAFTVITYSGNGWHKKNISGVGIVSFETSEVHNVWKMLAARRGDIVIEWPVGARAGIEKADVVSKIVETDVMLDAMPFHLLISKRSEHIKILSRFNMIIKEMLYDGTIQKIISTYY
ncbi:MAG: amino acid ABC transporter substrate-binding protein [Desulfobacteraceae bacterium]|nr:MAG: amino acid ABC transporter substrate-binding protein [Desulfobacteraceae bacterium]